MLFSDLIRILTVLNFTNGIKCYFDINLIIMLIMNGKFFIRLFFLLCVFIISQDVDAQYKFYVSMS